MKLRNAFIAVATAMALSASAQNPFVQTWCTSDPAPMVHDGTMYVYTKSQESWSQRVMGRVMGTDSVL